MAIKKVRMKPPGYTDIVHPETSADIVIQDSDHRFVTDAEKATWNAKGSSNLALGTTSTTAYRGDYGNIAYTHSQSAHAPSGAQVNQTLTSGNGMAAWTATNGNLTITLGTPSTITSATTNSVTTTSHTHALTLTKADITALGIPAQDTVYTHPSSHPASMITQDTNNRFVTDAEKASWNDNSSKIGNLTTLVTVAKTNLVSAVNELFTNVVNGKNLLVSALTTKGVTPYDSDFDSIEEAIYHLDYTSTSSPALASDIREGKIAWSNGIKIVGTATMQSASKVVFTLTDNVFRINVEPNLLAGMQTNWSMLIINHYRGSTCMGIVIKESDGGYYTAGELEFDGGSSWWSIGNPITLDSTSREGFLYGDIVEVTAIMNLQETSGSYSTSV